MAVLRINGYAVEGRIGYESTRAEIQVRREYSPNGLYQLGRNSVARAWRFTTRMLPREVALALAAMVQQRGECWTWGLTGAPNGVLYVDGNAVPEVWSQTRRVSQSLESIGTIISAYGADGARVYDWNGNAYGMCEASTGSLLIEPGTTNIATANMFDPSTTTGFTGDTGSETIGTDTSNYWTGSSSIKVTTTGGNEGVRIGTVTGQTDYTLSTFVKFSQNFITANGVMNIRVYDNTAAAYIGSNQQLTPTVADAWYRVFANGSPAGGASSNVSLALFTSAFDPATDFWVDGAHFEAEINDSYPTAPLDPGTINYSGSGAGVRPAGVLDFDTFVASHTNGFTVAAWVNVQFTGSAAIRSIIDAGDGTPRGYLIINTSNQPLFVPVSSVGGGLTPTGSALSAGWHFLVGVYNRSNNTAYLYVDGDLDASDNTWGGARQYWDIENIAGDFSIGTQGGAGSLTAPGPLGPMFILPYALPASIISGMYQSATDARPVPGLLPLGVAGDMLGIGERWLYCHAAVRSLRNEPYVDPATPAWDAAAMSVDLDLFEDRGR